MLSTLSFTACPPLIHRYHKLILAFLASFKPYVSADALLEHLTTLYTQLTSDAERLRLPPNSPDARASRTVRERVL